jgi:predicted dehydrogenase
MAGKIQGIVRVAIIGSGGISGAHAEGYIKHADKIRVAALCDIRPEALKSRSEQLTKGGCAAPATFDDWKRMLRELQGQIDAVDICLPHHLHCPAILDAAAAGLHILCEKPMCMSLEQADQIAAAVSKTGVTYMSAHNQLFMPVVQEAKRMIEAGELGRIFHLRSQDCFRIGGTLPQPRPNWGWRADFATQGGGELIDTGYHPSYRLLYLAGSPVAAVRASMTRHRSPIDGEDSASVTVRFAGGAIGEVHSSWAYQLPYGTHHIHVLGEKGQIFGSDDTLYHLPIGFNEPAKRAFSSVHTFVAEIGHFADCLREGRRPLHSVEEGRAVLALILQAAASAEGWQATAPCAAR